MPSNWIKQPIQLPLKFLNSGNGDSVVGGSISAVPTGMGVNAGMQNRPGDRTIVGEEDALAISDTVNVGTLYGGLYKYVTTRPTSTAPFTRGLACFWDTSVANSLFQVTADESGSQGVGMFAGVLINTLTRGNSWWIQIAGRVFVRMRAAFTGNPSDGCPLYLAAVGAGEPGVFDCLDAGGNPTYTQVGQMLQRYVGVANGLPVAGGIATTVELDITRISRW